MTPQVLKLTDNSPRSTKEDIQDWHWRSQLWQRLEGSRPVVAAWSVSLVFSVHFIALVLEYVPPPPPLRHTHVRKQFFTSICGALGNNVESLGRLNNVGRFIVPVYSLNINTGHCYHYHQHHFTDLQAFTREVNIKLTSAPCLNVPTWPDWSFCCLAQP